MFSFKCSNFASSWKGVEFDRQIASWDICCAKTSVLSFKKLPDKLSMPAALDGFKLFKILNTFLEDISKI